MELPAKRLKWKLKKQRQRQRQRLAKQETDMGRPRKADLRTFPRSYMEFVEMAQAGRTIGPLIFPTKQMAKATQLDINRFRSALAAAGHPGFEAMRDLVMTVSPFGAPEGEAPRWMLEFTPRGLYNLGQELKSMPTLHPIDQEGLPEFRPEPRPMTQDAEKLIEQMYGKVKTNEERRSNEGLSVVGQEIPGCPPHELDELTDGCIKCKLPKSLWEAK